MPRYAGGRLPSKMTRMSLALAVVLIFAAHGGAALSDLAPADEYFGHTHLSPLGIRHTILSLKDDLHHGRRKPDAIEHDALEVQDALQDWSTRYPRDSWIPSALWNLAVLYEELPGDDARTHAIAVLEKIRDGYSGTEFASNAQRDLARGIGVRPWPRWAGNPHPSAVPSPAAIADAASLLNAIDGARKTTDVSSIVALEAKFWALSHNGADASYSRCAWELAAIYESMAGDTAQTHAIRMLAFLVDRYPDVIYGRWALRDLKRGVGLRT